jgi:hypothetical protein
MEVSLDEAIEIHAKVLRSRYRAAAPIRARDHAAMLKRNGGHHGHDVWVKVAETAEKICAPSEWKGPQEYTPK